MKAIIVNTSSVYQRYIGLTFEVVEVLNRGRVALSIPNYEGRLVCTDFSHDEVFIVDIENEVFKLKAKIEEVWQLREGMPFTAVNILEQKLEKLQEYISIKNIQI